MNYFKPRNFRISRSLLPLAISIVSRAKGLAGEFKAAGVNMTKEEATAEELVRMTFKALTLAKAISANIRDAQPSMADR